MPKWTRTPNVIFTTAYDEYALKAFEVNALDYLLKPIEPTTTCRCDAKNAIRKTGTTILTKSDPISTVGAAMKHDQVFVKDGERCWFVKLTDIRLFESVGNYAKVYFGTQQTPDSKITECAGRTT